MCDITPRTNLPSEWLQWRIQIFLMSFTAFTKTFKTDGKEVSLKIIDTAGQVGNHTRIITTRITLTFLGGIATLSSAIFSFLNTLQDTAWQKHDVDDCCWASIVVLWMFQDEYSIFPTGYTMDINGYVLVYSVTSRQSFEVVKKIYQKLLDQTGVKQLPVVLVGNKNDLRNERVVSPEEGRELARYMKVSPDLSWSRSDFIPGPCGMSRDRILNIFPTFIFRHFDFVSPLIHFSMLSDRVYSCRHQQSRTIVCWTSSHSS